jgi:hypothetical protein
MRQFGIAAVACIAAVALLGGCNKNADKCCAGCKDKAAVKMDAGATPASDAKMNCCGKCKGACGGKKECSGASMNMDASATPATGAKKCGSSCGAKKSCADKSSM